MVKVQYKSTIAAQSSNNVCASWQSVNILAVCKVTKCPTDELSLTNCAITNEKDFLGIKHIRISNASGQPFAFSIKSHSNIARNEIGFSLPQRKWATLSLNEEIEVEPFNPDDILAHAVLEVDFMQKKTVSQEPYDTDDMAKEFLLTFPNQVFTVGQQLAFAFKDNKVLGVVVRELQVVNLTSLKERQDAKPKKGKIGIMRPDTTIQFERAENSSLNLVGKSRGVHVRQSIINPDWDFATMGIGGLSKEFNAIFRRAFASRVFPPEVMQQLGCQHVKGILLYGPPGTGKTLIARQIGKMLNAREPKIVNGPQILDKYVGESEANVRRLFAEAEEEEKRAGPNSGLHVIIFDEIDAICKQRGSVAGNTGVHDTVVNQLLSKIDGVEQLNNILVIGMTNRKDMIDEALLRPGRLEVQVEINLPDEEGRIQILNIHTSTMRKFKKMSDDVDVKGLATLTKNFSGAELEGLVRAAQSSAMNRLIKAKNKVEVDPEAMNKFLVTHEDFIHALQHDIKPAFGTAEERLHQYSGRGIIHWGSPVTDILADGHLLANQARDTEASGLVSVLIEGPPNAGKTTLTAEIARNSDFPFLKICSPEEMAGFTEIAKCLHIRKIFDDAYRSTLSCILVDNIERLLDYGPIGPRYSNLLLQVLLVLLKKEPPQGKKLLVICTSSRRQVLENMEMLSAFTTVLHVPNLSKKEHLRDVLEASEVFTESELKQINDHFEIKRISIGIKKLLALTDMARQTNKENRVNKFITKLEEEVALYSLAEASPAQSTQKYIKENINDKKRQNVPFREHNGPAFN